MPCNGERYVQHNYTDYANAKAETELVPNDLSEMLKISHFLAKKTGGKKGSIPFPLKLHQMLKEVEEDGLSNIVGWRPHGRCFLVKDHTKFSGEIMPHFFRQSKFSSFQRQLNLYGFKRLSSGPDKGAYYHELFLRGMLHLSYRIHRLRVKGQGGRKANSPETEPQFYKMPSVGVETKNENIQNTFPSDTSQSNGLPSQPPLQANQAMPLHSHAGVVKQDFQLPSDLLEMKNRINELQILQHQSFPITNQCDSLSSLSFALLQQQSQQLQQNNIKLPSYSRWENEEVQPINQARPQRSLDRPNVMKCSADSFSDDEEEGFDEVMDLLDKIPTTSLHKLKM
eukprot:CAMPEP_0178899406 /NCGR_PEP_ID=MMETSP0786-20121207/2880_1 /TAXON_ID=186022 /ORGANISM="Thalassionema frauenfeldii, Strain CCMP 1798" /LENGTH=339 /DNA_ID=CAMNT_0020570255 /DNA_START=111 /DNA_END=1130 /DNA_ORIENTATION=-